MSTAAEPLNIINALAMYNKGQAKVGLRRSSEQEASESLKTAWV